MVRLHQVFQDGWSGDADGPKFVPPDRYSLICLRRCLIVRPIYRTPQRQVNWHVPIGLVKWGQVSLELFLMICDLVRSNLGGEDLNVSVEFSAKYFRFTSFLNGNLINSIFLGTLNDVFFELISQIIVSEFIWVFTFNKTLCNSTDPLSMVLCLPILPARRFRL